MIITIDNLLDSCR